MSRGHGWLQRKILELLEKHPDGYPHPVLGTQEWTARTFCFILDADNDDGTHVPYSLMANIRRALKALEAEGLVWRRPSRSTYRGQGSVPWVWHRPQ